MFDLLDWRGEAPGRRGAAKHHMATAGTEPPERVAPIVLIAAGHIEAFLDRREKDAGFLESVSQGAEPGFRQVAQRSVVFGDQPLGAGNVAVLPLEQDFPAAECFEESPLVGIIRAIRALRRLL